MQAGALSDDPEKVALRRRILELEDELEEWRRLDGDQADSEAAQARRVRIRHVLRIPPASVRLLILLLERGGSFTPYGRIKTAVVLNDDADGGKAPLIALMHLRRALDRAGVKDAIETVHGEGLILAAVPALRIKQLLGEA